MDLGRFIMDGGGEVSGGWSVNVPNHNIKYLRRVRNRVDFSFLPSPVSLGKRAEK